MYNIGLDGVRSCVPPLEGQLEARDLRLQDSDFLVSLVHQFVNLGQLRKVSFGKRTVVGVLAYLGLKDSDLLLSGTSTNMQQIEDSEIANAAG